MHIELLLGSSVRIIYIGGNATAPEAQFWHAVAPLMPLELPAWYGMQASLLVAPLVSRDVPASITCARQSCTPAMETVATNRDCAFKRGSETLPGGRAV